MNTTTHHITDCDYCGAAAGVPCTTASGRPTAKPHAAREKAADAIRTEQPEAPQRFGYVCKSCGGPSPVGIGYVVPGAAAEEASADLNACACGYSVRPDAPAPAVEAVTEDQDLIDGLATSDEFTTPEAMFGPNWNTPTPTHDVDALLAHLNTLVPARTDEDTAEAEAAARAESAAFWTPGRIAEHDKIVTQHESVKATRVALAEFRATACTRCHGTGILPQFVPVNGGECFTCDGTGKR